MPLRRMISASSLVGLQHLPMAVPHPARPGPEEADARHDQAEPGIAPVPRDRAQEQATHTNTDRHIRHPVLLISLRRLCRSGSGRFQLLIVLVLLFRDQVAGYARQPLAALDHSEHFRILRFKFFITHFSVSFANI